MAPSTTPVMPEGQYVPCLKTLVLLTGGFLEPDFFNKSVCMDPYGIDTYLLAELSCATFRAKEAPLDSHPRRVRQCSLF